MSLLGAAIALTSCSDTLTGALRLPQEAADGYSALELNHRAINLSLTAPGNTVQLAVTPRNAAGKAVAGVSPAAVQYAVSDTVALRVTPGGLLTAGRVGSGMYVTAQLTVDRVTRVDTAWIQVVPAAPASPLATFSIRPAPGDSTRYGFTLFGGNKPITPLMAASDGTPMTDLLVSYQSSDPERALVSDAAYLRLDRVAVVGAPGALLSPLRHGAVTLTAATYAFGVSLRDSVRYTITWPASQEVDILERVGADGHTREAYFAPDTVAIAAGGIVFWANSAPENTLSTGVTFAQPNAATDYFGSGSGNVPPLDPPSVSSNNWGGRQFLTPGTYTYRDTQGRTTGVVVVKVDEP